MKKNENFTHSTPVDEDDLVELVVTKKDGTGETLASFQVRKGFNGQVTLSVNVQD